MNPFSHYCKEHDWGYNTATCPLCNLRDGLKQDNDGMEYLIAQAVAAERERCVELVRQNITVGCDSFTDELLRAIAYDIDVGSKPLADKDGAK